MDELLLNNIKSLRIRLMEEIVGHIINANKNPSNVEERKRADRLSIFIDKLNIIIKQCNKELLFDYADEINSKIQKYTEGKDKSYEYEYADYQYILISILNLFPHQNTATITNTFIKEVSNKVIERINSFKEQEG